MLPVCCAVFVAAQSVEKHSKSLLSTSNPTHFKALVKKNVNAFGVITLAHRHIRHAWRLAYFFPLLLFYTWGGFFPSMTICDQELVGLNF